MGRLWLKLALIAPTVGIMKLFNRDKIILDLCGGTGAWSKFYKDAGYDVRLITLPDHDVTDYIPPENVYGILAAPPCTEFSRALNYHIAVNGRERDFIKGMNPVNACCRIILFSNPVFWALENPLGCLSQFLGGPDYIFDPWEFGDPYTKKTCLWGKFNPPIKKYFDRNEVMTPEQIILCKENRKPQDCGADKKIKRAITPAGFAKAFYEANK